MGTTSIGMVLAEVVLGSGMAFASGADAALLFVTLQASERAHEYPRWEGRVRATGKPPSRCRRRLAGISIR